MSDGLAAAATSPAAAFARDGYYVMRGVLDQDTISSLRRDASARAAGQDLERDSTVWVHSTRELPLYAAARMDAAAYLELRAQGGASACPLIAQALLHTLPSVAADVTGWEQQAGAEQAGAEQSEVQQAEAERGGAGRGGWRLFNEHYVIKPAATGDGTGDGKPAGGGQHFLWHRDADRHLRCAERVTLGTAPRASPKASQARTAQPPAAPKEQPEEEEEPVEGRFYAGLPPSAAVAYVNTWSPLDGCDADNGTLYPSPLTLTTHLHPYPYPDPNPDPDPNPNPNPNPYPQPLPPSRHPLPATGQHPCSPRLLLPCRAAMQPRGV